MKIIKLKSKSSPEFLNYNKSDAGAVLLLFIFLLIILNPNYLNHGIPDMDEIWNYQYARRILFDQVPYRDFGMLQTPFAMQMNAIFLYLFGDKLIVMRWVASLIAAINGLVAFKILRTAGKNHLMSFVYTLFFLFPFLLYPKNNYSWYVVLSLSTALLLELKKIHAPKQKQMRYEVWIGIALGLTLITKQNIGMAAIFVSIAYFLYSSRYLGKDYLLKGLGLKLFGFSLIMGTELIYLGVKMNIVLMFKEMAYNLTAFAGSSATPYTSIFSESPLFGLLAILIPGMIIITFMKGISAAEDLTKKTLFLVTLYGLANLAMIVPISDSVHLLFGMPIAVLAISLVFRNNTQHDGRQKDLLSVILLSVMLLTITYRLITPTKGQFEPKLNHYQSVHIPTEIRQSIADVDGFIAHEESLGRTVYMLNYQAAFYLIPLDKFSYKYDTIGSGGYAEQEIINLLASTPNATVLIRGQQGIENWQETKKIEEYVRNNMKYADSLHGFDVYRR